MSNEMSVGGDDGFDRTVTERELAILVLDGSGSMGLPETPRSSQPTKARAIQDAISAPADGLFALFQGGSHRVNYLDFVVLVFDTWVETRMSQTPAAEIDLKRAYNDLNVLRDHGGETNIAQALEEAATIAFGFANTQAEVPQYATILLMSDGQHNVPSSDQTPVFTVVKRIVDSADHGEDRPSVVLACAPYGADADEKTLQQIATPSYYQKCTSAQQVRSFFIRSMASSPAL